MVDSQKLLLFAYSAEANDGRHTYAKALFKDDPAEVADHEGVSAVTVY